MEWNFKQANPIADISNLKVTINTKSKLSCLQSASGGCQYLR